MLEFPDAYELALSLRKTVCHLQNKPRYEQLGLFDFKNEKGTELKRMWNFRCAPGKP